MTEFNKGDIVYPTAETIEKITEQVNDPLIPTFPVDEYVAEGGPLRVVGFAPPLLGLEFIATVPVDSPNTDFDPETFAQEPGHPRYDDLALLFAEEIEHDGGVLAGV